MVLGWKFYVDPLFFGSNMYMGCVALCISFPKCPRSSKLEFGAKSYRHFSAHDSGSGPCPLGPVLATRLSLVLGSRPCFLGLVEHFYMCLKGQDPEMVRL
jgi:hypothetical protein